MTAESLYYTSLLALKSVATGSTLPTLAVAVSTLFLFSPYAPCESLVDSALRFFIGNDSNTPGFDLDKARPRPVGPEFKVTVMNSIPKEGRITKFNKTQLRKLASLDPILRLHKRESVYEYVVFKAVPLPFAFIGLNHRVALLISDAALDLLDVKELQATVAHEIGHEYVWSEYLEAERRNDERRLKELELICDGVAILTMRRAGIDPAALLTAANKITKFNALSTGPAGNAHRYPSDGERRRFAQAIIAGTGSPQPASPSTGGRK